MTERLVHCVKLGKELPGLARPPYRNELGQRIFDNVSKEGWQQWLADSVKFVNTYRVDLASPEGQKFMFKQCAVYFGFEQGEAAQTAWVPPAQEGAHKHEHGPDCDHDHAHDAPSEKKEG
jgi:Fe-S cluster biosynthesis and repair protein YggX